MWITIIDRTKPKESQETKTHKYYLKFKNVDIPVSPKKIEGFPFHISIQPSNNDAILEIDTTPAQINPKKAVYTAMDIIPLLFADKIQVKIPTPILLLLLGIVLVIFAVGFFFGYLL